jgi:hypothetical protein
MSSYVSAELRRLVRDRAVHICEYCLLHEDNTFLGNEVDHIISEKHGGPTNASNLAFACASCNRAKGSDIASLIPGTDQLVRLFNPRIDRWSEHFSLVGPELVALTAIGEATERILEFNVPERLQERLELIVQGQYPSAAAAELMRK